MLQKKGFDMAAHRLLLLTGLVLITSCAPLPKKIPVQNEDRSAVQGAEIIVTRQQTPGFIFTTPSKALVDAGMALWADPEKAISWSSVTQEHRVPDFTLAVQESFLDDLAGSKHRTGLQASDSVEPWEESDDFSRLSEKYTSDYVLEFRTRMGVFGYKPFAWRTYRMSYFGELVLIRLTDQKPVWKASCDMRPGDGNPLTLPGSDFLSGDGKLLRAAAAYATKNCGKQLAGAYRDAF